VLPFVVRFRSGVPAYEQVLYAVRKALAAGQLRPGDAFPSVRALSQELRINPNTAHKIVGALVAERLLEVRPGIGTVVAAVPAPSRDQRRQLLVDDVERLVVDARMLGLELGDVLAAVGTRWNGLDKRGRS
jgi:GntR family transcriptional regulator